MTADPRYFDKKGRIIKGDCYEEAAKFVVERKDAALVHGVHTNPDGMQVAHAWAIVPGEGWDDPQVFDSQFDGDRASGVMPPIADTITEGKLVPIGVYYWLTKNRPIKEYTHKETLELLLKKTTYGPWDAESQRIWEETAKKLKEMKK